MECRDPKQLRREVVQLIEKQMDTLEKETFCGLTNTELRECRQRQKRIHELYDKLQYLKSAAELHFGIKIEPAYDCDGSLCHQSLFDEAGGLHYVAPHCHLVECQAKGPIYHTVLCDFPT
jgi:hypothetical protein